MEPRRLLAWALRLVGLVELLAFGAVVMPRAWMQAYHEALGLGEMPEGPVFDAVMRQVSFSYGLHGVALLLIATDVTRYHPLVVLTALGYLVAAPVFFAIDLSNDMPWSWVAGNGGSSFPPFSGPSTDPLCRGPREVTSDPVCCWTSKPDCQRQRGQPMDQPGRVAGKVAFVTGAASGIGAATARLLAEQGASVLCADRNLDGTRTVAESLSGGSGHAVGLDVTAEDQWICLLADALAAHGKLDVLVNCAGISAIGPIVDLELAEWRRVMAVNLEGVFLGTKHGIRAMSPRGGSIINISSVAGLKASPGGSAYSASKAGVCMLTRAAAKECLEAGLPIRVNTVCPGGVKTPIWRSVPFFQDLVAETGSEEAAFEKMTGGAPKDRFAEPEEIAAAILYLASDESRFVTGTDLVIDNGYLA